MSDDDYSSEEERRSNRSQRHRREHIISSDEYKDEEGDDAVAPSSPSHYRSDKNEGGEEEEPAEEVSAKDVAGPQHTKKAITEAMKGNKRVDEITPNMVLNQTILDHYHNVRLFNQDQGSQLIIFQQVLLGGGS